MARAGIYKSEVLRARDKLLAAGRNPSIDAVREELGSGSKTTIHRYLKEIEEEEGKPRRRPRASSWSKPSGPWPTKKTLTAKPAKL